MEIILTKQPAVSVIIPIYNAAPYLERCLDSLARQTLTDIEIICVNDGSTDETPDILDMCAAADPRIIVINRPNAGQSAARNAGIARASGQYLGFADADDYLDSDFYEKLYQAAVSSDAAVVQASTRRIGSRRTKVLKRRRRHIRSFADAVKNLNHGAVWDKIFRAEIIKNNNVTFLDGRIYEDNLFAVQALWFARSMKVINNTCYNYIFTPASTTTSPQKEQKRRDDSLIVAAKIIDFAAEQNMRQTEIRQLRRFILDNFINSGWLNDEKYFAALQQTLHDCRLVSRRRFSHNCKIRFKNIRHKIKDIFK